MATVRYTTKIPYSLATVSITRQGTLTRYFRDADANGQVEFYDYELAYGYKWDVKYKAPGQNFWSFHETVEILEGFEEGLDIAPPDDSTYNATYTGLD